MLLAVARPTLYDAHPTFGDGEAPLERIDLGALDETEAEHLVRELLRPVTDPPASLIEHAKRLGGMPRTLFEFVRLLLEAEVIVRGTPLRSDGGLGARWSIDAERLARLRLPEHHEEILNQRLRQMAPAERDLLEKAAVCGERFWLDAVVALVRVAALDGADPDGPTLGEIAAAGDRTRLAVAQTLARLVEREWLVESPDSQILGEREYVFAYPPLWDVVYEGIDEASRRRYHRLTVSSVTSPATASPSSSSRSRCRPASTRWPPAASSSATAPCPTPTRPSPGWCRPRSSRACGRRSWARRSRWPTTSRATKRSATC
jgi:predicted ATPase